MSENENLLSYEEVLTQIEKLGEENHLLLGNGFNMSVGVFTRYEDIYKKMIEMHPLYKKLDDLFKENMFDVEKIIQILQKQQDDINNNENEKKFMKKFILAKFKLDFLKALYKIIHPQVNKIHKQKEMKKNIWILFRNFKTYFTLNFDPMLYLILMKFKNTPDNLSVAYKKNSPIFDLDEPSEKILYGKVKELHEQGTFATSIAGGDEIKTEIKDANMRSFITSFRNQFGGLIKTHKWSDNNIKKAINYVTNQEDYGYKSTVDDGFRKFNQLSLFNGNITSQNVFFLHGCLHMISESEGDKIRKIEQTEVNSLFDHIEESALHGENKIMCVLSGTSTQKTDHIKDNSYLSKCYEKLGEISGNIVVLGFAASKNDSHILSKINRSDIKRLYFGTNINDCNKIRKRLKKCLPDKDILFFDYETINFSKVD